MFVDVQTISSVKIWNHHPIEAIMCKWLLRVPGTYRGLSKAYSLRMYVSI